VAGGVLLIGAAPSCRAQTLVEWQVQGLGRFATSTFMGGGFGVALRSAGRERISLSASAGSRDGALAGRGEIVVGYYLSPARRDGLSLYGIGGAASEFTSAGHQENIVLALGVESSPAGKSGWFAEAGVAGGFRASLGLRFRHRPS
jgi:hypothetical protein